jgi:3-methyladenine DNA glycosylase Tag
VFEKQREISVKDEQIQKLTEENGILRGKEEGKEEAKVNFARMFQEMKHIHS